MNEKRRPPSLHRGPLPEREPMPDPSIVTFIFTMTNREIVSTTAPREALDGMSEEISGAIAIGKTITLHDPSGNRTIVNTAHVILVSVR
jgi:hypothetical protein